MCWRAVVSPARVCEGRKAVYIAIPSSSRRILCSHTWDAHKLSRRKRFTLKRDNSFRVILARAVLLSPLFYTYIYFSVCWSVYRYKHTHICILLPLSLSRLILLIQSVRMLLTARAPFPSENSIKFFFSKRRAYILWAQYPSLYLPIFYIRFFFCSSPWAYTYIDYSHHFLIDHSLASIIQSYITLFIKKTKTKSICLQNISYI